jgi:Na+(H+)/acetate symporter ActP
VMNEEHRGVKVDPNRERDGQSASPDRRKRRQLWVNWGLALLTAVGAAAVMAIALGSVMSTAACSDKQCPNLGPGGISFNVLFYGAPVVAALTIVVSFFTAQRRWGFVVPLSALALLIADAAVIVTTVAQ